MPCGLKEDRIVIEIKAVRHVIPLKICADKMNLYLSNSCNLIWVYIYKIRKINNKSSTFAIVDENTNKT